MAPGLVTSRGVVCPIFFEITIDPGDLFSDDVRDLQVNLAPPPHLCSIVEDGKSTNAWHDAGLVI